MTAIEEQSKAVSARTQSRTYVPYFLMEGVLLGTFMISACLFGILLEHPASIVRQSIDSAFVRRILMGLAMGATAMGLIYSPFGKRSGAHMNPAMTLCFLSMRKIKPIVALGYVFSQFIGGAIGVGIIHLAWQMILGDAHVNWVTTRPGSYGVAPAWISEFTIAFVLIVVVMQVNKRPRLARFTGCFAGLLVATYITFEAPISGMSLNPARSFASAFWANQWAALWIYFAAPPLGMLAGVQFLRIVSRHPHKLCGKLCHSHSTVCIFKCSCLGDSHG